MSPSLKYGRLFPRQMPGLLSWHFYVWWLLTWPRPAVGGFCWEKPENECLYSQLLKALLVGQMLNTIYPMRIGDFSRAYVIGGIGPGRVFTMGTILLEKLLDMFSYSLLFILLILLIRLPAWVSNSAYSFTLVVLIATLAIFLLA